MATYVSILLLCLASTVHLRVSYRGYRVYEVTPSNSDDVKTLRSLREKYLDVVDFWSEAIAADREVLMSVDPQNNAVWLSELEASGLQYRVAFEDLEALHEEQRAEAARKPKPDPYNIDFERYHRVDTYNTWLDHIAGVCGSRCEVSSIGRSHEGRDVRMIKITGEGSSTTSSVFVDGTYHAREWIAPATVVWLINVFVRNYSTNTDVRAALDKFDWYFAPMINPDGYEYSHDSDRLWRKNRRPSDIVPICIGTDLNRNFDFEWDGGGASPDPCSDIYTGDGPFSEVETQNLRDVINRLRAEKPIRGYVTFHSHGSLWLSVWGYTLDDPPNFAELQRVGEAVADSIMEVNGNPWRVGTAAQELGVAAGGGDDWVYAVGGATYSYTPELPGWGYAFELPEDLIRDVLNEVTPGVLRMSREMAA